MSVVFIIIKIHIIATKNILLFRVVRIVKGFPRYISRAKSSGLNTGSKKSGVFALSGHILTDRTFHFLNGACQNAVKHS